MDENFGYLIAGSKSLKSALLYHLSIPIGGIILPQICRSARGTGRNQPSTTRFIFGLPAWARSLIKPEPETALAYLDFSSQEIAIAACLSGDDALWQAYASGDPYIQFAIDAGLAPVGATKESHKAERDASKVIMLGVQYGM